MYSPHPTRCGSRPLPVAPETESPSARETLAYSANHTPHRRKRQSLSNQECERGLPPTGPAARRSRIPAVASARLRCKTSRAVRREIKIARMKQALCKLVAGGLHCDVDGVYSTMNVVSVIVSVSLSVPRDATSDNSMSWYVPFAGVSPPSGEISPCVPSSLKLPASV